MHEYKLYPEYAIKEGYDKPSEPKRLKQDKLKYLTEASAEKKPVKVVSKYFLSLPTNELPSYSALKQVFPATTVYGSDFHREQAWTRWVQNRKNALNSNDASHLLEFLCACAWAPPGTDDMVLD